MAFEKKTWLPRISEYPNRRILTDTNDVETQVLVTRDEGVVSQQGDKFDADTMNDLEDRIDTVLGGAEFSVESDGKLYASWTVNGQTIKKALGSIELDSPLATVDKVVSGYHFATIEDGETVERVGTIVNQGASTDAVSLANITATGTGANIRIPEGAYITPGVSGYPVISISNFMQTKSVTPSRDAQTIAADSGRALRAVTVNAIPARTWQIVNFTNTSGGTSGVINTGNTATKAVGAVVWNCRGYIQGSTNGSSWTNISGGYVEAEGNNDASVNGSMPMVMTNTNYQYIRFNITWRYNNGNNGNVRLFAVYN